MNGAHLEFVCWSWHRRRPGGRGVQSCKFSDEFNISTTLHLLSIIVVVLATNFWLVNYFSKKARVCYDFVKISSSIKMDLAPKSRL